MNLQDVANDLDRIADSNIVTKDIAKSARWAAYLVRELHICTTDAQGRAHGGMENIERVIAAVGAVRKAGA